MSHDPCNVAVTASHLRVPQYLFLYVFRRAFAAADLGVSLDDDDDAVGVAKQKVH